MDVRDVGSLRRVKLYGQAIGGIIVKTVQSGSSNCSFEVYVISVEEMDTAAKELPGSPGNKQRQYDPYHSESDTQTA
jgi:hypothetical protein